MINRLKKAFITNETQFSTVCLLTFLNIIAMVTGEITSILTWIFALCFWGVFAFVGNFFNPIPKD